MTKSREYLIVSLSFMVLSLISTQTARFFSNKGSELFMILVGFAFLAMQIVYVVKMVRYKEPVRSVEDIMESARKRIESAIVEADTPKKKDE